MRDSLECPNCQRKLAAPVDAAVEVVSCPGCGTTFPVNEPDPDLPPQMVVGCPYCQEPISIHMDHPAPVQLCSVCRKTITRPYLLLLARRAGYPVVVNPAEVEELQQRPVLSEEMETPVQRIAWKNTFVSQSSGIRQHAQDTAEMRWAFVIGTCLPTILFLTCCVIPAPREIPWAAVPGVLLFSPVVGLALFIYSGLDGPGRKREYTKLDATGPR